MQSHGQSRIIGRDGNILCEAKVFGDEILTATLDMSRAKGETAKNSLRYAALKDGWGSAVRKVVVRD